MCGDGPAGRGPSGSFWQEQGRRVSVPKRTRSASLSVPPTPGPLFLCEVKAFRFILPFLIISRKRREAPPQLFGHPEGSLSGKGSEMLLSSPSFTSFQKASWFLASAKVTFVVIFSVVSNSWILRIRCGSAVGEARTAAPAAGWWRALVSVRHAAPRSSTAQPPSATVLRSVAFMGGFRGLVIFPGWDFCRNGMGRVTEKGKKSPPSALITSLRHFIPRAGRRTFPSPLPHAVPSPRRCHFAAPRACLKMEGTGAEAGESRGGGWPQRRLCSGPPF